MKRCCDINFCGRGPADVICKQPPEKIRQTVTNFYHPCPRNCCKCPDIWPTLLPRVKCCIKPIAIQNPPTTPVMPRCRSLRKCPEGCPKPRRPMSPERIQPPVIPCCKPCCVTPIVVRPKIPRIRCLDPVIPCCPPPCIPPPKIIHPPEPPYPPYCPVFPPCGCPDRPLIVHNSVRQFRITSECKQACNMDNPLVCYIAISPEEMGQVNFRMGSCYNTC